VTDPGYLTVVRRRNSPKPVIQPPQTPASPHVSALSTLDCGHAGEKAKRIWMSGMPTVQILCSECAPILADTPSEAPPSVKAPPPALLSDFKCAAYHAHQSDHRLRAGVWVCEACEDPAQTVIRVTATD
jgi:hypothetical protein